MGPIDNFHKATDVAKFFGGIYVIFSGVIFLTGIAIIIAPVVHKFLHKFHAEGDKTKD